jgi:lipoyl(octanoyl) transferase
MIIKDLGLIDYALAFRAMKDFTLSRKTEAEDELWLCEHPPVFSQGSNGKEEHLLNTGSIPVFRSDRGGQVTYHGPGQLIAYTLFDLKRSDLGVKKMVMLLEQTVISLLAMQGLLAYTDPEAPGVYVEGSKIASLGLRIKRGCCYHGISLNVDMDLSPFLSINPCGIKGMKMIDLKGLRCDLTMIEVKQQFVNELIARM